MSTAGKVIEALAAFIGGLGIVLFGRLIQLGNPNLSGFEKGSLVGYAVGAIVIGLVVRWVWVKLRKRGRVLSGWVFLIAALVLFISLLRGVGPAVGVSTPAVPIDTYIKVGTPFALAAPAADVEAQFREPLERAGGTNVQVRAISDGTEIVAYLLVANLGTADPAESLRGFESGFERTAGNEAHPEVLAGENVVVGAGVELSAIFWTEGPYALITYAADVTSARVIAESVIGAYQ
jgi:hypothetical protein